MRYTPFLVRSSYKSLRSNVFKYTRKLKSALINNEEQAGLRQLEIRGIYGDSFMEFVRWENIYVVSRVANALFLISRALKKVKAGDFKVARTFVFSI